MADFKQPESWTPEKDQEQEDLDNNIESDLRDEDNDPDILQYNLLAKKGLA